MRRCLILFCGFILVLAGCQREDICIENAPTTPKLIIKFYDIDNPDLLKPVTGFNAKAANESDYYFSDPVTDTVAAIPLRTYNNTTTYTFVIHQDDSTLENRDTISFTYTPEDVFISRACGYKVDFYDFNASVDPENAAENWIKEVGIPQPNAITNEKDAHLYIYH